MEFAVKLSNKNVGDPSRQITNIESAEHRNEIIAGDGIVVIKYSAVWCGPCKKIAPEYMSMCQNDEDGVTYCEEDVDEELGPYAEEIKSIPAFHIFNKGALIYSCKGSNMEALSNLIIEAKNIK